MRDKKIPRWAEDLEEIARKVTEQNKNPEINPLHIYGRCVV
jgi:hypothetical protein